MGTRTINRDANGITEENAGEISEYAKMMYERKRYDEVEADYKALRKEKKDDYGLSGRNKKTA